jgi:hypothetical protein
MNEFLYNPPSKLETVTVGGVALRKGDRVRIQPRARADALDIALAGRTALIESIEVDVENKIHLALVIEDDPGLDLGLDRMPGHRFFYGTDEVEPMEGE